MLGLAALAVAAPLHAQNLVLGDGDTVIVSGAGTVGTIGGKPISNAYSSYSGGPFAVQTNGTSTFTLETGGALYGGIGGAGLYAAGSGVVNITGGKMIGAPYGYGVVVQGSGPVNITGGTIIGGTITDGPPNSYAGLLGFASTTINLYSQNDTPFLINGIPMNNTSLGPVTRGTISGTLLNGDTLNTPFGDYGTLNLNVGTPPTVVPEPSPLLSLSLLLLGTGGMVLAGRRKKSA